MKYQFDVMVDRWNHGSAKWEIMKSNLGEKAEGVIAVSTADMDFPMAPEIVQALHEAADRLVYGYTVPTEGYYESLISWMRRRHRWTVKREGISCSPGIVAALYYCLYAFTDPGDGVIIQSPVYPPFATSVRASKRTLVLNPLRRIDGYYEIDFEDLEKKAALAGVKMIFLCNPHNPVGRVWTLEELRRIAKICSENDVMVVSDEIHLDLLYPPREHTVFAKAVPESERNWIVCTSPSKSFNIAGLQISGIFSPDPLIKKKFDAAAYCCGFHSPNVFACAASSAAYDCAENWLEEMLQYIAGNDRYIRSYIAEHLPGITVAPLEATYLQWIDFSAWNVPYLEREKMIREKAAVYFDSGHIFGEEGRDFERFNIAYPRFLITEVLERIRNLYETEIRDR